MWQERMKNRCSINQSLHIAVLLSLKSFFVSPAEAQLLEQENERLLEQLSSLTNAVDQVGSTPPPRRTKTILSIVFDKKKSKYYSV